MEQEDAAALTASLHYVCTNLQQLTAVVTILRENGTITKAAEDEILVSVLKLSTNEFN